MAQDEVFKIVGSVLLKDSEFISGLKNMLNEAENTSQKIAQKFETIGKGLGNVGTKITDVGRKVTVGTVAVLGSVGALTKTSIQAYAEYEQLVGGVETLFGAGGKSLEEYAKSVGKPVDKVKKEYDKLMSSQSTVLKNSKDAYITAGMSQNEYMETVTSFSASLIQSLKGDTEKAAKYSQTAIVDMSDNANKMGTDISMIQNAYQGFAKQNYTMLDNLKLGYGGTKTEMQRLVKDASKLKGTQKELGVTVDSNSLSFANIVNAIHVVQAEMGIMGTTSKEAEGTISGSINMMKGAWSNFLVGMADDEADFEDLLNKLLDSVGKVAKNIIPRVEIVITTALKKVLEGIKNLTGGLPPVFGQVIDKLINLVDNFKNLDSEQKKQVLKWIGMVAAIGPALMIFGKLTSGLGTLFSIIGKVKGAGGIAGLTAKFGGLLTAAGPVIGIIAGVVAGIGILVHVLGGPKEALEKLINVFGKVKEVISTFLERIDFKDKIDGIKNKLGEFGEKLKGLEDLFKIIGVVVGTVVTVAFSVLSGIFNGLLVMVEPVITAIGGVIDILSGLGSLIVGIFTLDGQKIVDAVIKIKDGIVGVFAGLFGGVVNFLVGFVEGVIEFFISLWDTLVGHSIVPDTINAIIDWFKELLNKPIKFVKDMKEKVVNFFGNLKDGAVNKAKEIASNISNKFGEMKSNVVEKANQLKTSAVEKFNSLKNSAVEKFNSLKSSASEKFNSIKSTISSKVSDAKSKAVSLFNDMNTATNGKLGNLVNTVSSKFGSVYSKISEKMSSAKGKVSEMLGNMKSSFENFGAKIKLPHFKVSNFSLNPKDWIANGMPKISVDWYAKAMDTGMILNEPTIFGINRNGQLMGGGEKGSETIVGTNSLMSMIASAVSSQNAELVAALEIIFEILAKYLPLLVEKEVVLDSGEVVGALTPKIDKALGDWSEKRGRGR